MVSDIVDFEECSFYYLDDKKRQTRNALFNKKKRNSNDKNICDQRFEWWHWQFEWKEAHEGSIYNK